MNEARNCIAAPKVSVVIPVHNGEEYLSQSVGSVLSQTLRDIEIICVNDASTDRTAEILDQYAMQDARVKVIHREVCGSALQARKQGVAMARGEYIMFLDDDDYFAPNACEAAYGRICREQVDILQFSVEIINCGCLSQGELIGNRYYLRPYRKLLRGKRVLNACFLSKKYAHNLCNKIFSGALCKRAFADMENRKQLMAEDLYAYFVLAHYASSYYGWEGEPLYFYCWGRGLTMANTFDMKKFEGHCHWAEAIALLERFCQKKALTSKRYKKILERYRKMWLAENVWLWENRLPEQDRGEGLEMLYRYWGRETVDAYLENRVLPKNVFRRLFRAIPMLPEKILGGFRCLRDHGILYTLGRVKVKFQRLFFGKEG